MNIYDFFKIMIDMFKDLYGFCYNLLFYDIGSQLDAGPLYTYQILGFFAAAGLGLYVVIKIVQLFIE